MKIDLPTQKKFTPHEEGTFDAVCVDVTPLIKRQTQYGEKDQFNLVFHTDAEGDASYVWSRRFTPSLHEKASFRKFLKQWFGKELNEKTLEDFDTEMLIGHKAKLIIQHEDWEENTYANIALITSSDKGPKMPKDYIRVKDREDRLEDDSDLESNANEDLVDSDLVVHVGKNKGKKLSELSSDDIKNLREKWLPKADKENAQDYKLAAALCQKNEF